MAVTRTGVQLRGLVETIEAAKLAQDEWGKATLREIRRAINPIRDDVRNKFQELGGTGPRTAATVRATVTQRGAGVQFGSAKTPFAMGREFGAKRTQTRTFIRRVQTGRNASRVVGGGSTRASVSHIPYNRDSIFGPWTGNDFSLGDAGGRLTFDVVSGHAFYPNIGKGAQNVYDALDHIAQRTIDRFPGGVAQANTMTRLAKLETLLKG